MNLRDIVLNYLADNEKAMQQLIKWFLNDVMKSKWHSNARSSSRRAHGIAGGVSEHTHIGDRLWRDLSHSNDLMVL
jgi:hypothetical protein